MNQCRSENATPLCICKPLLILVSIKDVAKLSVQLFSLDTKVHLESFKVFLVPSLVSMLALPSLEEVELDYETLDFKSRPAIFLFS